tara:strand:- start:4301 stop:5458 length:1158 start_codon:yes stop_codon:yes gene_type:complete
MAENKCSDKKIEKCKDQGKECNPKSGRCIKIKIKKPKSNKKVKVNTTNNNIENMSDVDKLIYHFYETKEKYENILKQKIKEEKMKDISYDNRNNATRDEDFVLLWKSSEKTKNRIKIVKNRMKCLFCEQEGGMMFTDNTDKYEMKCLGQNSCCHLIIKKGIIVKYNNIKKKYVNDANDIKEKIIKCKLKILYNLEDEDIILQQFENLKTLLSDIHLQIQEIEKKHIEKKSFVLVKENKDILSDKDEDWFQEHTILKSDRLNELNIQLHQNIKKFKEINKLIKNELQEEKILELKKDYVNTYIEDVLPIINEMHILKYDGELNNNNNKITDEMMEESLLDIAYSIDQKTIEGVKYKVVYSNNLQTKNKEIILENAKKEKNNTNFLK